MSLCLQCLYRRPIHHHGPKLLELFIPRSLLATCFVYAFVLYLFTQSCPTFCVPLDCGPPGSHCITIIIVTQSTLALRSVIQKFDSFPLTFKLYYTWFWPSQTYKLINRQFVFRISVLSFIVFLHIQLSFSLLLSQTFFSSTEFIFPLSFYSKTWPCICVNYLLQWAWLRKINSARENQPIRKNGASITDSNTKWAVNSVTTDTNSL